MEAAPGATATGRNGGVSLPAMSLSSSQPSRKEWRVVSEQSARNSGNEEMERSKLGQSDERLIYEVQHRGEPFDVGFSSITVDGGLDNENLQQRLHTVAKQREELQNMEIELRADVIARSEIVGLRNTFDARVKEHANATVKLQEQLHEKEQKIHELERRMDEKERELHAVRLDTEAAWAKEDLLREQSKEIQSYRRDRDNSEAERAQHIQQILDLQEHMQDKERQFIELQEQQRIAQETILFKDEQIREAQAWITRAQEMDVMQSTTNHTLQAELRERTEQYNQLWLGCQRQFGEMERLHVHIQQLQFEIADAREKSGSRSEEAHLVHTNTDDASRLAQVNGSQLEVNDNNSPSAITGSPQNDKSETSGGNLAQADHEHGVSFAPSSLFGMPTYLPTALHPFVMHQQGVLHPSHVTQSHFHSLPAMSSVQNWQNQQALSEGENMLRHNQYSEQTEENLMRTDIHYGYEALVNGQVRTNYSDAKVSPTDADPVVPSLNGEGQLHYSIDESNGNATSLQDLLQISSQFHDALRLDPLERGNDTKLKNDNPVIDHRLENKITSIENSSFVTNGFLSEVPIQAVNFSGASSNTVLSAVSANTILSTGQKSDLVGNPGESYLLDERALLASIARTIGSGSRIRISSTLANRLGKMIAPLHWHDYKKKYGKLDDFVASHPDLFLIEGDYIQLRGGAQQIIAATTAVAKVAAAAAAAPPSYSSVMPSVAMTPMAQSNRFKKVSSLESSYMDADKASFNQVAVPRPSNTVDIFSKSNDHMELNGSESRPGWSAQPTVGNGTNSNRNDFSQSKGASHGRPGSSLVGKQHSSRPMGAAPSPRR
ncbi:hypothetical protein ABFS82_06G016300 [Erythranthe guttata]|uniref:uncharacterized protein LOC105963507 isoform X1 n=1 Tax=Erythranthe guttata TaxID=4155 RepID=UPI00064DF0C9|nr:PREDICTED: uncharacterized protein LOC105963507 isoform X1 [Erythranthe guttata]|eukprot:XP_012843368.1 PREDICTED: uncharacterized protein LOC105963507 isoform X1 [Erythranthe guttata]